MCFSGLVSATSQCVPGRRGGRMSTPRQTRARRTATTPRAGKGRGGASSSDCVTMAAAAQSSAAPPPPTKLAPDCCFEDISSDSNSSFDQAEFDMAVGPASDWGCGRCGLAVQAVGLQARQSFQRCYSTSVATFSWSLRPNAENRFI